MDHYQSHGRWRCFLCNQDIKKAIDNKIFVGPRITGAAHYISITGGGGDINYMSPEQNLIADGLIADGPQEIIKAIRKEIKYGSDWIKIMVTGAFMSVGDNPENVSFSPEELHACLLYTSPSPRDGLLSRMPSSA